jgi:hypothetical protein
MLLWALIVVVILLLVIGWHAYETRRMRQALIACTHEVRYWQQLLAFLEDTHPPTRENPCSRRGDEERG